MTVTGNYGFGNPWELPKVGAGDLPLITTDPSGNMDPNVDQSVTYQKRLDDAQASLNSALAALAENEDPEKEAQLQEIVNAAYENYQKTLNELARAGFLEKYVIETPETKAGGRTVKEEIYENGKLICTRETKFDENNNVVEVIETADVPGLGEVTTTYNGQGQKIRQVIVYESKRIVATDYFYDENGELKGYVETRQGSNFVNVIYEKNCDKNGEPLIGRDGKPLDHRVTYVDSPGRPIVDSLGNGITDYSILEFSKDGTVSYYSADGNLVAKDEIIYDELGTALGRMRTIYKYDSQGRVVSENKVYSPYNKTNSSAVRTIDITYQYNEDGTSQKTTVETQSNGSKVITVENIESDGFVSQKVEERYDENGVLTKRTTTQYDREDTGDDGIHIPDIDPWKPVEPLDPDNPLVPVEPGNPGSPWVPQIPDVPLNPGESTPVDDWFLKDDQNPFKK